jgi:hypothetical protein
MKDVGADKGMGGNGKVAPDDASTRNLPKASVNSETTRKDTPAYQQPPGPRNC